MQSKIGLLVYMGARDELNRLKWHPRFSLLDAKVTIVHRGAPGDVRVVKGSDIKEIGRAFMRVALEEGLVDIPYHRILRIEVRGRTLWRKRGV